MAEIALIVSHLLILVSIGIGARLLVNTFPTVPFTIILVIVGTGVEID